MGSETLMRERSGPISLIMRHVCATMRHVSQIWLGADVAGFALKARVWHARAWNILHDIRGHTVRSRYKRQLIQLNMNKSGLHGLECKTRDPYSLENDSRITRTHCMPCETKSANEMTTNCQRALWWQHHRPPWDAHKAAGCVPDTDTSPQTRHTTLPVWYLVEHSYPPRRIRQTALNSTRCTIAPTVAPFFSDPVVSYFPSWRPLAAVSKISSVTMFETTSRSMPSFPKIGFSQPLFVKRRVTRRVRLWWVWISVTGARTPLLNGPQWGRAPVRPPEGPWLLACRGAREHQGVGPLWRRHPTWHTTWGSIIMTRGPRSRYHVRHPRYPRPHY